MPFEEYVRSRRAQGRGYSQSTAGLRSRLMGEEEEGEPQTFIGGALRGGEWALGGLADVVARHGILPIAKGLEPDPFRRRRLEELERQGRPLYTGEIMEVSGPWARDEGPEANKLMEIMKGPTRFMGSLITDPLSYVGFGITTKVGRAAKAISAAKRAKQPVKLTSKVAKEAAKATGRRPSAELIRTFQESLAGKPVTEQIRKGQRSFASFDIPFTDVNIPLPFVGTGRVAGALAAPFSKVNRAFLSSRLGREIKKRFSTMSGHPEFDEIVSRFKDLASYRAGLKVATGRKMAESMDILSRRLGVSRDHLNRMVTEVVETGTAGMPIRAGKAVIAPLKWAKRALTEEVKPEWIVKEAEKRGLSFEDLIIQENLEKRGGRWFRRGKPPLQAAIKVGDRVFRSKAAKLHPEVWIDEVPQDIKDQVSRAEEELHKKLKEMSDSGVSDKEVMAEAYRWWTEFENKLGIDDGFWDTKTNKYLTRAEAEEKYGVFGAEDLKGLENLSPLAQRVYHGRGVKGAAALKKVLKFLELPIKGKKYQSTGTIDEHLASLADPEEVGWRGTTVQFAVTEDGQLRLGPGGGHQNFLDRGYDFNDTFEGLTQTKGSGVISEGWFEVNSDKTLVPKSVTVIPRSMKDADKTRRAFFDGIREWGVVTNPDDFMDFLVDLPTRAGKVEAKTIPVKEIGDIPHLGLVGRRGIDFLAAKGGPPMSRRGFIKLLGGAAASTMMPRIPGAGAIDFAKNLVQGVATGEIPAKFPMSLIPLMRSGHGKGLTPLEAMKEFAKGGKSREKVLKIIGEDIDNHDMVEEVSSWLEESGEYTQNQIDNIMGDLTSLQAKLSRGEMPSERSLEELSDHFLGAYEEDAREWLDPSYLTGIDDGSHSGLRGMRGSWPAGEAPMTVEEGIEKALRVVPEEDRLKWEIKELIQKPELDDLMSKVDPGGNFDREGKYYSLFGQLEDYAYVHSSETSLRTAGGEFGKSTVRDPEIMRVAGLTEPPMSYMEFQEKFKDKFPKGEILGEAYRAWENSIHGQNWKKYSHAEDLVSSDEFSRVAELLSDPKTLDVYAKNYIRLSKVITEAQTRLRWSLDTFDRGVRKLFGLKSPYGKNAIPPIGEMWRTEVEQVGRPPDSIGQLVMGEYKTGGVTRLPSNERGFVDKVLDNPMSLVERYRRYLDRDLGEIMDTIGNQDIFKSHYKITEEITPEQQKRLKKLLDGVKDEMVEAQKKLDKEVKTIDFETWAREKGLHKIAPEYWEELGEHWEQSKLILEDLVENRPRTAKEFAKWKKKHKGTSWTGSVLSFCRAHPGTITQGDFNLLLTPEISSHMRVVAQKANHLMGIRLGHHAALETMSPGELKAFTDNLSQSLDNDIDNIVMNLYGPRAAEKMEATIPEGFDLASLTPDQKNRMAAATFMSATADFIQDIAEAKHLLKLGKPEGFLVASDPFVFRPVELLAQSLRPLYGKNYSASQIEDMAIMMAIDLTNGKPVSTRGLTIGRHFVPPTRNEMIEAMARRWKMDPEMLSDPEALRQMSFFKRVATSVPGAFNTPLVHIPTNVPDMNKTLTIHGYLSSFLPNMSTLTNKEQADLLKRISRDYGPEAAAMMRNWYSSYVALNLRDQKVVIHTGNMAADAINASILRRLHITGPRAQKAIEKIWRSRAFRDKPSREIWEKFYRIYKEMVKDGYPDYFAEGRIPETMTPIGSIPNWVGYHWSNMLTEYLDMVHYRGMGRHQFFMDRPFYQDIKTFFEHDLGFDPISEAFTTKKERKALRALINRNPKRIHQDYMKWVKAHEMGHRFTTNLEDPGILESYYSMLPEDMFTEYKQLFANDQLRNTTEALHVGDIENLSENFSNANAFYLTHPGLMRTIAPNKYDFFRRLYTPQPHRTALGAIKNPNELAARVRMEMNRGREFHELAELEKTMPELFGQPTPDFYIAPKTGDPALDAVVREFKELQDRQLMNEMTSGVRVIPLLADIDYIAHVLTPEAREAIKEYLTSQGKLPRFATAKEFNQNLANAIRRQFVSVKGNIVDDWVRAGMIDQRKAGALKGKHGLDHLDELFDKGTITEQQFSDALHTLTVSEVNEIAAQGKLSITGGKPVREFFHTDPVYSTTVRGVRGEKARTAAEFYKELVDRGIALPNEAAPETWVRVRQPELSGYKVDPEIADVMNHWYEFMLSPRTQSEFLRLFDATQDAWKAWTLAIFPAYHTRNFVGNMWNNFLAGIYSPRVYKWAAKVQAGQYLQFTDGLGKIWNTDELIETAKRLGVLDRGWVGADIQRSISQQLQKGTWKSLGAENRIVKLGFKVGRTIENNARMGHFIHRLQQGDTAAEAAMSVKKYLFDYSDLTPFEQKVMKRLFPFYTWTRKNVPLQIMHLITRPAKMGVPFKVRAEVESGKGIPDKYLPAWMAENFPTRVRYNEKNKAYEYFLLNSWLPAYDMVKLLEIHETALNMLTPLPKELIQQIFNYDFFLKRKVENIPGQREKFLGVKLPTRAVHAAKVIRLLNELDKLTDEDRDLASKFVNAFTGKLYPLTEQKAMQSYKFQADQDLSALRRELSRELRKAKPDMTEVERIKDLIRKKFKGE